MPTTKIALLGTGFIADIHLESYRRFVPDAEVVAVYSRSRERAEAFARKHGIGRWFDDLDRAATDPGCDVVDVCLPNDLHARATIAAAKAGKHVIIEKPLCLTLDEADEMIAACQANDRKLMYAEELCFAPKYERVRKLVERRGDRPHLSHAPVREALRPAQRLVLRLNRSGGGVLMDMGCHGLAWFRWMLGGRPRALSVSAHMQTGLIHQGRTRCEENSRLHRRVRGRRDWRGREQLGHARRHGGSRRGLAAPAA